MAARMEALIKVPAGGAAVSATNSGGGPTVVTVPAASYFLTAAGGISSLLTTFEAQLNSSRDPAPGTWTVSLSTATGLVTIDCTSGSKITKTGGSASTWDSGACTSTTIAGDGYVESTVLETGKYRAFGISASGVVSTHFNTIDYGFYLKGGGTPTDYAVVENGSERLTGTYAADDKFTIDRTGTTVTYYKNGTLVYTSLVSSIGSLMIDSAFFDSSSTISAIYLYDAGTQVALTWGTTTNTTATSPTWSLAWTSTDLRDLLGFTADISAVSAAQTSTQQARGLWIPDCPLNVQGDPQRAPRASDSRTQVSPTGESITLVGNTFRRHRSLVFPLVPIARTWAAEATYVNASWEEFFGETQLNLDSSWFTPGSLVQIYDHNGIAVGADAGVAGWSMIGVDSIEPMRVGNWTGLWRIEIPLLIAVDP